MSNRRSLVMTVAAVLVGAGLLALWWPVYLDPYDRYGVQISCERGFTAGLSQVVISGGDGGSIVKRCGSAARSSRLGDPDYRRRVAGAYRARGLLASPRPAQGRSRAHLTFRAIVPKLFS